MIFFKAKRLNERGRELSAKGWFAEAESAYRAAADANPQWSVPWYNLALMQKYRAKWQEAFDCNLRATELAPSDGDSWWNLGIAATALGRWDVSRRAWLNCGISILPGEGPIEMELGPVPIRLAERGGGEVVWSKRIDPTRAVLANVPLPTSGHRWGDVVLHDGAANGYRLLRGKEVPVFGALACLQPSIFSTFIAEVQADATAQLETERHREGKNGDRVNRVGEVGMNKTRRLLWVSVSDPPQLRPGMRRSPEVTVRRGRSHE